MSKPTCEVCSKIFYSDGTTCNECATNMDGVERNKYDTTAPKSTPSIEEMSEVVAKYMCFDKFQAKHACHTVYGSFDFFDDELSEVYVKGATDEFRKHLILSNPEEVGLHRDFKLFEDYHYTSCLKFHSSWDWIHKVWEKVRNEKHEDVNINFHTSLKFDAVKWCLVNGTPLEALTALYNAIELINNLKQENNEK